MGWQGYAVLALISNGNAGNHVLASGNADQDTQGTLKTLATNLNGGDSGIWRSEQSRANPSPREFPGNKEKYRESIPFGSQIPAQELLSDRLKRSYWRKVVETNRDLSGAYQGFLFPEKAGTGFGLKNRFHRRCDSGGNPSRCLCSIQFSGTCRVNFSKVKSGG